MLYVVYSLQNRNIAKYIYKATFNPANIKKKKPPLK